MTSATVQMDFTFRDKQFGVEHCKTYPFTSWDDCEKEWGSPIDRIKQEWASTAWPGGYPVHHITADGGTLCPKCANKNLFLTLTDDPQWQIVASEVNWEATDLACDNCYERIESAYGEEETSDERDQ